MATDPDDKPEVREAQQAVDEALGRGPLTAVTWVLLVGTGLATVVAAGLVVALALMGPAEGRVLRAVLYGGGALLLGAAIMAMEGWSMISARRRLKRREREAADARPSDENLG
jgi:hypothetical protein